MKVFISWSGPRSRAVAKALHACLKLLIQASDPWMSAEDLDRGKRWGIQLAQTLETTNFGIVCLTPENLVAPYILFEAGALAKRVEESFVCTYLIDLKPTDVASPLSDFQATIADREDTLRMFSQINGALSSERQLTQADLETLFSQLWPKLEEQLAAARSLPTKVPKPGERTDRDLLEEVLNVLRAAPSVAAQIQFIPPVSQPEVVHSLTKAGEPQKIFSLGAPVRHPVFGFGRVLEIYETGAITRLRVYFYAAGEKTLSLHITNLQVVPEPATLILPDTKAATEERTGERVKA